MKKKKQKKVYNPEDYPSGMTITVYASYRKQLGLSGRDYTAVKRALELGRIKKNEHGLIDPIEANERWAKFVNPDGVGSGNRSHPIAVPNQQQTQDVEQPNILTDEEVLRRKRLAEMHSAEHKSRLDAIKVEEAEGELLRADSVDKHIFEAVRIARNALLNIPSRVAILLASETNEKKIEALLDKEMRNALDGLARKVGVDE
jgi:hypothetical protein